MPAPREHSVAEGVLLSAVAGSVDGLGYVLLRVFTAHITGNTVHVATQLASARFEAAAGAGFAIALFVAGAAGGALLREASGRRGWPARAIVLGAGALLLVGFAAVGTASRAQPGRGRFYALAALAAFAAGSQNAVGPVVGGRRVRSYITGTMTEFAEALVAAALGRPRDGRSDALGRAGGLLAVWLAYLGGGFACGAAAHRFGTRAALLPAAGLAVAVAIALRARRYSSADG